MNKVAFLESVHPVLWERLEAANFQCVHAETLSRSEILAGALSDCTGVVLRSRLMLDAELINAMPALCWIARSGSGLENIDLAEAEKRKIRVHSSPEGNATSVGEHAVGQLLMLLHKLNMADAHVRAGGWDREAHRGSELETKTVGIIGFGNMGQSFAQRLRGFGCRVLVYDKYVKGFDGTFGVEEVSIETLQSQATVVSLHVPLTDETRFLVNAGWIASFSNPFYFINTARGEIVETAALLAALDNHKIIGAALDVLEFENRSLEGLKQRTGVLKQLLDHPRTVLSPHVAGWSVESYFKLSDVLADKILLS